MYPSRVPIGYRNDKGNRTVVVDAAKAEIVTHIFETYASWNLSLSALRKQIRNEFGIVIARSYLHRILANTFFVSDISCGAERHIKALTRFSFRPFCSNQFKRFSKVTTNRSYRKNDIAFRGLLKCAYDGSAVTAEFKKQKYVYFRCTGYHGKCDLPRFTQGEISKMLASVLEGIRIPDDVLSRIQNSLQSSQSELQAKSVAVRSRCEQSLSLIRKRMSQAYVDKLDGKIEEEFWTRQMQEWQFEERQIRLELESLKRSTADSMLTTQRCLELANKACFLYPTRKLAEQAELLRLVLLNCAIDRTSVYPTYRKPFDMIFERAKEKNGRGERI